MRALRQFDAATGEVLQSIEMSTGISMPDLGGAGQDTLYCGVKIADK